MPGLLLILTDLAGARFRAGLEVAATAAAMGRPVRVLVKAPAIKQLAQNPSVLTLLQELGAELIVCQTDLSSAGLEAASLPPVVEPAGLLHAMRETDGWQLLLV